jgi:hypothetical protein
MCVIVSAGMPEVVLQRLETRLLHIFDCTRTPVDSWPLLILSCVIQWWTI